MTETLGNVCRFLNGGTPSKAVPEYFDGDIPWITSADITGPIANYARSFITDAAVKNSAVNKVAAGSVLLVTRTGVGKVAIAANELCFSQDITALIPESERLDAGYLVHFLRTKKAYFLGLARGATIQGITRNVVSDIAIPLPSLPEQRRIAAILDQADALRAKRREALAQLDSLTQSIFIELFGDPVSNSKQWTLIPFGKVCDSRLGKMLDQKQQTGSHVRKYLRNANVQWFQMDLADVYEMDFDEKARQVFRLKRGDLLICEGGEPGRAAIWRDELSECYYQKALHRARPNPELAIAEYLAWLLWFLAKRGGLADHVTAATIAHLTGEKLKAMSVPIPPMNLQLEFAKRLEALATLEAYHRSHKNHLDSLFSTLQHRAFRGEL